jgi:hypothetical protein
VDSSSVSVRIIWPFPSTPIGLDGSTTTCPPEVRVLRGQLLDRVEPDGKDDGVGLRDRLFDRSGAREVNQLLCERCRIRFVLRREDHGPPPRTRCRASVPPMCRFL